MYLDQDRMQWWAVVNTVTNLRLSYKTGNLLTSSATISFSRKTLFHGVNLLNTSNRHRAFGPYVQSPLITYTTCLYETKIKYIHHASFRSILGILKFALQVSYIFITLRCYNFAD
jgi:hypothetical protein